MGRELKKIEEQKKFQFPSFVSAWKVEMQKNEKLFYLVENKNEKIKNSYINLHICPLKKDAQLKKKKKKKEAIAQVN